MSKSVRRGMIVPGLAVLGGLLTGCGSNPYQLAPVRGRVTCQGKPTVGGIVTFMPIDAPEKTGRPAGFTGVASKGTVQADGTFTLTYMDGKSAPGALIGPHRILFQAPPTRQPTLSADDRASMSPEEIRQAEEMNRRMPIYPPLPCSINPAPAEVEVKPGENAFEFTLQPK
jgi:hypothetical protein